MTRNYRELYVKMNVMKDSETKISSVRSVMSPTARLAMPNKRPVNYAKTSSTSKITPA